MKHICEYGCGREGKFQFANGKWCCEDNWKKCSISRKKYSIQMKELWADPDSKVNSKEFKEKVINTLKRQWDDPNSIFNSNEYREKRIKSCNTSIYKIKRSKSLKELWQDPNSIYNSDEYKIKRRKMFDSDEYKVNMIKSRKLSIEQINKRYPFFSKIEEIRYNPEMDGEIQVHCKNHNCPNSKEKGGWFTPTYSQISERIRQLETDCGIEGSYFYCSQHCKDVCPLYNLRSDPYKTTILPYTEAEYQVWRQLVLELDKGICQFCGEKATDVHHIKPVKTHPHLSLDLDNGISFCQECHYKIGHKTGSECSTGNLAKIVCSTESQRFLNQQ